MHRCCVCETNENEKFETFSFFLVLNKKNQEIPGGEKCLSMSLNVENVEMFMNLSAFAVQERIKVRARLAGNRKERSFFPRSHQ
jgi:hypothetical protein